ncbi:hypothetical protein L5515_017175 [Caenorhabditis briggsae]|uniref:Ste50 sterile alpha motif domain-containing protein n=1 Tax=Caenorhabditis briggsae TaxID=6238 RepID=A0AAE8ZLH0_CAEBR|nr:hypothetical protein L3Y34_011313 [Caenorhabditis briggsae]UMM40619.1 hypothetical protein L5515_017175 [Caenorhabditis briggsae]
MDPDRAARFPLAIQRLKRAYLNGENVMDLKEFAFHHPPIEHPDYWDEELASVRDQLFWYHSDWFLIWCQAPLEKVSRDMAHEIAALPLPLRRERLQFPPEKAECLPHGCPLPPNTAVDDFWHWSKETVLSWMALVIPQEHQNGVIGRLREVDLDGGWLPELAKEQTIKNALNLTDTQHMFLQGFAIKVINRYHDRAYAREVKEYEKYVSWVHSFLHHLDEF